MLLSQMSWWVECLSADRNLPDVHTIFTPQYKVPAKKAKVQTAYRKVAKLLELGWLEFSKY